MKTEARALRRRIGPAAWVVLEELLLTSQPGLTGALEAAVNVRDLAELTGMSKDAVARAVRRLVAGEVVVRRFGERGAAGAFGSVAYELRTERLPGLAVVATPARRPADRPAPPGARQAALFGEGADG